MRKKFLSIAATFLGLLLITAGAVAQNKPSPGPDEKAKQKMLKVEAANAFWRLKRSMDEDAFYNTRIRLNVWRSTALKAGTFDQAQYDDFKQRLYQKSVDDSLKCYEEFVLEENFHDANICLQTWRMHSKEIGLYQKDKYDSLKERLKMARIKKAAREAQAQKAE